LGISFCYFFLGLIVILVFKKEISGLLNRAEKISATGIETRKVLNQISDSSEKSDVIGNLTNRENKSDIEAALNELDTPLVREMEDELEKNLLKDIKQENRDKVLLRLFTGLLISHNYEQIYKTIFGSQISLLEIINTVPGSLNADVAASIYNNAKEENLEIYKEYLFSDWLNYLISQNLILIDKDGKILLTVKGKDFLLFLVKSGYTKHKPF